MCRPEIRTSHQSNTTGQIAALYLPAAVQPRGVLGGEEHESGVGLDDLLRLSHKQLPVVVQQPVEGLQDVGGGQVELVQDDPVAFPHGVDENTWWVEGEAGDDAGHAGVQQGGCIKKNVLMYIQIISVLFVFAPSMFFSELYNLYIQNKQDTVFYFFKVSAISASLIAAKSR